MTEHAPTAEEFDLTQFDTHVCLVSHQAAANILPIVRFRPKKTVLVVSPEMTNQAEALRGAILRASPRTKIDSLQIDGAYNYNNIRDALENFLLTTEDDTSHYLVNVTGGTKLMAFGALAAVLASNLTAFYLNQFDNTITIIQPNRELRVAPIPITLSIGNYLSAYGYESTSPKAESLSQTDSELIHNLLTQKSMKSVIPTLNWCAQTAENNKSLSADTPEFLKGDNLEAFNVLCDYFQDARYLRVHGKQIDFANEDARFFVKGGWLERFVLCRLQALGYKPVGNLKVRKNVENEIDVAFLHKNFFCIVECKTCKMNDAKSANEVLYKLETLQKIGGSNTRLFLVSFQPLGEESKIRAATSHITVIAGDKINQFDQQIRMALSNV